MVQLGQYAIKKRDITPAMLTGALFTRAKPWRHPKCPSQGMVKMRCVVMEYLSATKKKKKEIMHVSSNTDRP